MSGEGLVACLEKCFAGTCSHFEIVGFCRHQMKATHDTTLDAELLTKEELATKMNLPSTRMVDGLVARRKIPVIRLGHRTVRFRWGDVQTALDKLTVWDHAAPKGHYGRTDCYAAPSRTVTRQPLPGRISKEGK